MANVADMDAPLTCQQIDDIVGKVSIHCDSNELDILANSGTDLHEAQGARASKAQTSDF